MRRWSLVIILLLGLTEPSLAWEYNSCEDPLTDQKCAALGQTSSSSVLPVMLALKCWEKGEIQLRLILPAQYEHGANYKLLTPAEVRIDKNDKFPLIMIPMESSSLFSLAHVAQNEDDLEGVGLGQVLRELRTAKSRLVFGINSQLISFSTAGIAKPLSRFLARCAINLDKPSADDKSDD